MTDSTGERLRASNIAMIEAIGMHWANEERKMNKEGLAYGVNDFYSLINSLNY